MANINKYTRYDPNVRILRLLSKRQDITNVGDDVEKREPSYTVGGNVN